MERERGDEPGQSGGSEPGPAGSTGLGLTGLGSTPSRRSVLATLGVTATVAALGGCLGGDETGTPTVAGGPGLVTRAPEPLPPPRRGAADAPVTVSVYVDFACPHCQAFHRRTLPRIEKEFVADGVAVYEHRDFPLPVADPGSYRAANAARAVQATQGESSFFEFADLLFENQDELGLTLYESLATEVGADPETVRRAAENRVYRRTIDRDVSRGKEAGVNSTPTVLVNGEVFEGRTWSDLAARIEAVRTEAARTEAARSEPS